MPNHSEPSSSLPPPHLANTDSTRKRKRRNIESSAASSIDDQSRTRWRTDAEQRIYSTKLLDALRHVNRTNDDASASTSSSSFTKSRNVRAAADRVLAVAAKGTTRWSRAILKSRKLRSKILKKVVRKNPSKSLTSHSKFKPSSISNNSDSLSASAAPLDKRLRTLGRLVPGGHKLSLPNLLEETTDYIAALEMQVRAMAALAELLTGGSSSRR